MFIIINLLLVLVSAGPSGGELAGFLVCVFFALTIVGVILFRIIRVKIRHPDVQKQNLLDIEENQVF